MAAVDSIRRSTVADVTTAWLIGIARHKLVDHWRRAEREQRRLHAVADDPTVDKAEVDPWDVQLDVLAARDALERARRQAPRCADAALPRRPERPRGRHRPRAHRPRHRGVAGAGADGRSATRTSPVKGGAHERRSVRAAAAAGRPARPARRPVRRSTAPARRGCIDRPADRRPTREEHHRVHHPHHHDDSTHQSAITPYICVSPAIEALAWYEMPSVAVETIRYTGDDGRIGHAEIADRRRHRHALGRVPGARGRVADDARRHSDDAARRSGRTSTPSTTASSPPAHVSRPRPRTRPTAPGRSR